MLKLISVNIETNKHYKTILPFLDKENADVICLQEVPELFAQELQTRGYHTAYAPMLLKDIDGINMSVGVMIASKYPFTHKAIYYHQNEASLKIYTREEETRAVPYLFADIAVLGVTYCIATTHMVDTENGKEDDFQILLTEKMLTLLTQEHKHTICGDFNMPRGYNRLYEKMTTQYQDSIPFHYQSSLDRNIHRLGQVKIDEPIFDKYMVDYIFTQAPYQASDVRLQFGVSDHAAVIATLTKLE